ncbi:hypothetical protein [Amycolatopsis eburnea]|uniref:Uncharacterized protein n=1 Tax=Amycolatopsis eburnea TaxID=2267691 RepID=A0A427T7G3_9PSEU|nr:hypothetical protein [Amycolatopsis eburnea]RSD16298.1 hypothetical protein EIY87_21795 [Amycolatopsis eburnea]
MQLKATWRALTVTYAVVAGMQVYLAISMDAGWASVLGAVFTLAAVGSGFAARRSRHLPAEAGLPRPASPVIAVAGGNT